VGLQLKLDTIKQVETPEGIHLPLRCANVPARALAWAVDFCIRVAVMWVVAIVVGLAGQTGMGIYLICLFTIFWAYPILFEVLRDGQTIGKRVFGLRVVHHNGTPIGWLASITRNLLRTVDMLPFAYGFGLVAALTDAEGRRWGDRIAGSIVVYVDAPNKHEQVPTTAAGEAKYILSTEEQSAVIAFAERSSSLTLARQQELIKIIEAVLPERNEPVDAALALANRILGRA
jgi:uncharacterized RDD family membrane protein YckC